jgi:hypothetical protein
VEVFQRYIRQDLLMELAHMVMESEKSHKPSVIQRLQSATSVAQYKSKSLRTRKCDDVTFSPKAERDHGHRFWSPKLEDLTSKGRRRRVYFSFRHLSIPQQTAWYCSH